MWSSCIPNSARNEQDGPCYWPGWVAATMRMQRFKAAVLPGDATIIYQAACVYSITSNKQAKDLDTALEYLRRALRNEFRDFPAIDSDHDIDALRKLPDFGRVMKAARKLIGESFARIFHWSGFGSDNDRQLF